MTVEFNNKTMPYFKFGSGDKNMVILPGMSLHSVMASEDAVKNDYAVFTEDYTVYLFERTDNMPEGYTCRDMAHDTAEAMKVLGINDAYILGVSQGGMIAFCLAIDHPEIVNRMVIASSLSRPNEISNATFREWIRLSEANDVKALNHDVFERIYSDAFRKKYSSELTLLEGLGTPEECARFKILAEASLSFSVYDELDKIKCPVFVIGSVNDPTLSGEASVEAAKKLGAKLFMYEGYSHAAFDEAPDYKQRIMDFFSE